MQEYFAALPADRLAGELLARIDAYYNWLLTSSRLSRWRLAYETYYGQRGGHSSSYVTAAGEQGELSFLMSNEYRNLIQHLLVLAFQAKPSLETVAINTDSTSKAQAYVAKGIIEYFRRDGKIDDNTFEATEISLIMDSGWVFNEWDKIQGQELAGDPDMTGEIVQQGDIKSRARTPLDVVVDFTKPQGNQRDWILVRDPVNKYDLASQYMDKAEDIIGLERDTTRDALFRFGDVFRYDTGFTSPDIDIWTFYHRKSPAMPMGRMFQFATAKVHLYDGPNPYRKLPGNRICPTEQILSCFGYSNANDLLGLQDVMDALISSAVTNMTSCGVNNIWTKPSPNFDFDQLAQGMNLIESDEKPEVLILNKLPPEWFSLANFIVARMEAISGVNSVARGNTQGKDLSGAAMALLQSMAIQFNNGLVRAVNRLIEENGNDILMLTQDFASEPKMGMIIGEMNKYMMQEYSGKDLARIQRVYCRQSNPVQNTTAGKMELLQTYQQIPGFITSPAQITEILETGQLDSSTERERNLKLAIDQENEAIIRGEVPPVMFTDNPVEHLKGHSILFASPSDRKDPDLITRARSHYDAHLNEWKLLSEQNPALLQAMGFPPYPMPPMPPPGMMPPGQEAMPPGQGAPALPPGGVPPSPQPNSPPPEANQPNFPENPLTGEQWNPESGGGLVQGAA